MERSWTQMMGRLNARRPRCATIDLGGEQCTHRSVYGSAFCIGCYEFNELCRAHDEWVDLGGES